MKNVIFIFLFIPITLFAQDWHEEERIYEYDNLNRLVKVFFNSGTVYEYQYDNLGNRLERLVYEAPKIYVPDDAFEQKLIELGYDTVMDDYVYNHKIDKVKRLYVSDLGITDLTGIEGFIALENLECLDNNLTTLDVSQNLNLERLYCAYNQLTTIDISNNSNLKYLYCHNNELNSVDVSSSVNLIELGCDNNKLTELDVSNNLLLEDLFCGENILTSLDVSKNNNLKNLSCRNLQLVDLDVSKNLKLEQLHCSNNNLTSLDLSKSSQINYINCQSNNLESLNLKNGNNDILLDMRVQNNTNLICIQVDDHNAANNNTGIYADWQTDTQIQYSYNCESLTYVPDDAFEQRLIDLGYDVVLNNYAVTDEIDDIKYLYVSNEGISDLTGIEDFKSLEDLLCESNQLTFLNLSSNLNLKDLWCSNNQITDLDLSKNIGLEELGSSYNEIKSLNLTENKNLKLLECTDNDLTSINIKNGNNNILNGLWSRQNPNLYCIQVDDENAANNDTGVYATWDTDSQVEFSEDCAALGLNEFGLPFDNYTINTVGLTCINSSDGVINIRAEKPRDYTVQIVSDDNGINDSFPMNSNNGWEIYKNYFEGGEYFVHITLDNVNENLYKKTFILNLQEPEPLEAVNRRGINGRYVLEITKGTTPYTIKVNSEVIGVTNESEYSFDVQHGDIVEVSTSKACEGKYIDTINVLDDFTLYPSPTNDIVYFAIPISAKIENLDIQLFDMNGRLVETFNKKVLNSKIELSIKHLSNGIYLVKFPTLGEKTFKIIKK